MHRSNASPRRLLQKRHAGPPAHAEAGQYSLQPVLSWNFSSFLKARIILCRNHPSHDAANRDDNLAEEKARTGESLQCPHFYGIH